MSGFVYRKTMAAKWLAVVSVVVGWHSCELPIAARLFLLKKNTKTATDNSSHSRVCGPKPLSLTLKNPCAAAFLLSRLLWKRAYPALRTDVVQNGYMTLIFPIQRLGGYAGL